MENYDSLFIEGKAFQNVYFIKFDASTDSDIVISNPIDRVKVYFDLIEKIVSTSINENRTIHNCKFVEFWGWQGDSGLCIIHDESVSKAQITAFESAFTLLDFKLPEIKNTLSKHRIKGNFHMRISIHKGSFEFKKNLNNGGIHSKELNFVYHLCNQTPKDSVTISQEVYKDGENDIIEKFIPLDFTFMDNKIYIYKNNLSNSSHFEWMNKATFHNSFQINVFPERISEEEKATYIKHAKSEVVDFGTAAKTCSIYLDTTQRPAHYRAEVIRLLDAGVDYKMLIINPDSEVCKYYENSRGENLVDKTRESIKRFKNFAQQVKDKPGKFKVYLYSLLPYFACISVDRKINGSFIYSPYMPDTERADTAHYVLSKSQNMNVFNQIDSCIDAYMFDKETIELHL